MNKQDQIGTLKQMRLISIFKKTDRGERAVPDIPTDIPADIPADVAADLSANPPENQATPVNTPADTNVAPAIPPAISGDMEIRGLDDFKRRLPEIVTSLEQFTEGSEADFMLLGIGLRSVHSNVRDLTELMVNTVKRMGTDKDGGLITRGRQALNASLDEIQARQHEVKANLERIKRVMGSIEALHETTKQIKQFAKSLKIVALTMLIENARTIDMSVNIFSDVAGEIKDLSVSISGIANDIYKNVENARHIHQITREDISVGIDRLETLTTEIYDTVQGSTRDTEELMRFSVDTMEQAGRRSEEISRQVAEIVVGVQFHDNMKQRAMYINTVLEAMAASAELAVDADADPATDVSNPAGQPAVPVIWEQADRLDAINTEVDAVYQKNKNALGGIREEVADLLHQLKATVAGTGTDPDGLSDGRYAGLRTHDPFFHLRDALVQLHDLMDRGNTLYKQIQDAAENVSGIAGNLSELLGVVRNISANTHNKSINSIIAAERQGEKGGALKILAQEMNDLATQSEGFSRKVERIIASIVDDIDAVNDQDTKTNGPDNGSVINQLNEVLREISLGYDAFRADSLTAYERAKALMQATDTTLSSLDFFAGLSNKLTAYRDELTDLAAQPGQEMIRVDISATDKHHMPDRHIADRDDNVILFENVKKQETGQEQEAALGNNVELF